MAQKQFVKQSKAAHVAAPAKPAEPKGGLGYRGGSKPAAKAPNSPSALQEVPKRRPPAPAPERKADELPLVSVMPRREMDLAISLMSEDVAIQEVEAANKQRRQEIKTELAALAKAHDMPGMRHGQLAVYYGGQKTKWSLNRALLLENGVTPQQLEDSMKESKPYIDLRIVDLSKPRGKQAADDEA